MCGEAQPAVSQTSWREAPENRAFEDVTFLVECALISRGIGIPHTLYAIEIASTIHVLMVALMLGTPSWGTKAH